MNNHPVYADEEPGRKSRMLIPSFALLAVMTLGYQVATGVSEAREIERLKNGAPELTADRLNLADVRPGRASADGLVHAVYRGATFACTLNDRLEYESCSPAH